MLPRNSTSAQESGFCGQKLIAECLSLDFEPIFHSLEVLLFSFGEDALVVGLSGGENVENDSRQLMRRGR